MTPKAEILLEGTYLYFQGGNNYAQENFKLVQMQELPQFHIYSEVLSRIETGDFLKVIVRYEMTNHYIPYFVRMEKSIGSKYAVETFRVDERAQELLYSFESQKVSQEFKRAHSLKHYLTSPSFATAAMFLQSKKMDATGRTAVTFVTSNNEWSYAGPPTDNIVYADIKSRELDDYRLNNHQLQAAHLCLYEHDSAGSGSQETPMDIYVSKHHSIPYQMVQGDHRIEIKHLKKHN